MFALHFLRRRGCQKKPLNPFSHFKTKKKMKKTFLISLSLLIISLLSSCKKDPQPTIYSGRVLERVSNKPIANARISIRTCTGSFDTGKLSCTELDSTFSDAEGKFSYTVANSTRYNNHAFASKKISLCIDSMP